MKGKKRVHAFKNRMEHWQVVSIGLTVYDAIAMILAFFLALWFRFDCRYTMIPKEYLNFYFKFILIYAVISIFVFRKMRLYNSIWRFASYSELLRTVVATGITFVIHCVGMNVIPVATFLLCIRNYDSVCADAGSAFFLPVCTA